VFEGPSLDRVSRTRSLHHTRHRSHFGFTDAGVAAALQSFLIALIAGHWQEAELVGTRPIRARSDNAHPGVAKGRFLPKGEGDRDRKRLPSDPVALRTTRLRARTSQKSK
jgi:hypothetical protein